MKESALRFLFLGPGEAVAEHVLLGDHGHLRSLEAPVQPQRHQGQRILVRLGEIGPAFHGFHRRRSVIADQPAQPVA